MHAPKRAVYEGGGWAKHRSHVRSRRDMSMAEPLRNVPCGVLQHLDEDDDIPEGAQATPADVERVSYRFIVEGELRQLAVFAECSEGFLRRLARGAAVGNHPPQSHLCTEREAGSSMFVVLRGAVGMMVAGQGVGRLEAGEYFGEVNMLGVQGEWAVTLVTEAASTVCELRRHHFLESLACHPGERPRFQAALAMGAASRRHEGTLLNPCWPFRGLDQECLETLDYVMVPRIFWKSQRLMEEGKVSCGLHILLEGKVSCQIAGRVVRQQSAATCSQRRGSLASQASSFAQSESEDGPPMAQTSCIEMDHVIFGAGGILDVQGKESSTVVCTTSCHVRILYRALVTNLLQTDPSFVGKSPLVPRMPVRPHLEWPSNPCSANSLPSHPSGLAAGEDQAVGNHASQQLLAHFAGRGCTQPFLNFLAEHLEDRFYGEGQDMLDEQEQRLRRSLQVLCIGAARAYVEIRDDHECFLEETAVPLVCGQVFGDAPSLGLEYGPAAAVRATPFAGWCQTRVLHQNVVVRGLELFPDNMQRLLDGMTHMASKISILDSLQRSDLFSGMHPTPLRELSSAVKTRIFMPGDFLMKEGDDGTSMFIMIIGGADVLVRESSQGGPGELGYVVAKLRPGSVCGEMAMLGVSTVRTATVQAKEVCIAGEVDRESAMAVLQRHPVERDLFGHILAQHLDISVTARITQLPLLSGFDRKVRDRLSLYSERAVYFSDQAISREGQPGSRMYVINIGQALLKRSGLPIRWCGPGSHVGAENMLGISKTTICTIFAATMCHCLSISRESYEMACMQFPTHGAGPRLLKRQLVVYEHMRQTLQQVLARKRTWSRYQRLFAETPQEATMERYFIEWREAAALLKGRRRQLVLEEAKRSHSIQEWVTKLHEGRERVGEREQLKKLVQGNVQGRGPLQYLDSKATGGGGTAAQQEHQKRAPIEHLAAVFGDWPAPRASPHYGLRLWQVLGQALQGDDTAAPLLPPLLQGLGCPGDSPGATTAAAAGRAPLRGGTTAEDVATAFASKARPRQLRAALQQRLLERAEGAGGLEGRGLQVRRSDVQGVLVALHGGRQQTPGSVGTPRAAATPSCLQRARQAATSPLTGRASSREVEASVWRKGLGVAVLDASEYDFAGGGGVRRRPTPRVAGTGAAVAAAITTTSAARASTAGSATSPAKAAQGPGASASSPDGSPGGRRVSNPTGGTGAAVAAAMTTTSAAWASTAGSATRRAKVAQGPDASASSPDESPCGPCVSNPTGGSRAPSADGCCQVMPDSQQRTSPEVVPHTACFAWGPAAHEAAVKLAEDLKASNLRLKAEKSEGEPPL